MTRSVAQAKRQATIDVLARAAQMVMIERGLDFTMDDVADAAEVSRSTVFRHFATRDDLIATAATVGRENYVARMPVYGGGDCRAWLHEMCLVVHEMNALAHKTLTLATNADGLSERLRAVGRELDEGRRRRYPEIAGVLWKAINGKGPVPDRMTTVVATYLSPFFTAAVRHDAGADHLAAARMAEQAIVDVVTAEMLTLRKG